MSMTFEIQAKLTSFFRFLFFAKIFFGILKNVSILDKKLCLVFKVIHSGSILIHFKLVTC